MYTCLKCHSKNIKIDRGSNLKTCLDCEYKGTTGVWRNQPEGMKLTFILLILFCIIAIIGLIIVGVGTS